MKLLTERAASMTNTIPNPPLICFPIVVCCLAICLFLATGLIVTKPLRFLSVRNIRKK
jgi:hypothetical protein